MYPVLLSGRCCGLLVATALLASAAQLPVRVYTTEDGLPGNRVNRIVRDSRGFLWFGTQDGLARFDGLQFTPFGRAQGLPEREILDFVETSSGDYWVAVENGLFRLSKLGVARRYPMLAGGKDHAPSRLSMDPSGTLWVAAGLLLFRVAASPDAQPVQQELYRPGEPISAIFSLLADHSGIVWAGTYDGVIRRWPDGRTDRFTGMPSVARLIEDRKGGIWLGTFDGLFHATLGEFGKSDKPELVYRGAGREPAWIVALALDSTGKVIVGVERRLGELDPDAGVHAPISWKYTAENGLADTFYFCVAEDLAGNLWVGGESRGAMKIVREGMVSYGIADGMDGNRVLSLFPDRSGALMAYTTMPPVLNRWNGQKFTAYPVKFPPGVAAAWGWQQIVLQDHLGEWWVASQQGVLHYAAMPPEKLARATPKDWFTPKDGLAGKDVFHLYEDKHGDVWIATTGTPEQNGLSRWVRATGRLQHFTGLRQCATAFVEDSSGTLWVGSIGWLARFRNGRFEEVTVTPALAQCYIRDLLFDAKGRLWIGGVPGLFRIDDPQAAELKIREFTAADGLSSNLVYTLAKDRMGRIYAGGKRGLDRLDAESFPGLGTVQHYSQADGLAPGYLRASYCDRNGDLWFGALSGLTRMTPQRDRPGPQPPEVWITGLSVRNTPVNLSKLGETRVVPLVLDPSRNQLEVKFSSLSFWPGEAPRFQYRLDSDTEWSSASNERTINYGSLAAGHYHLTVRAVGRNGIVSQNPAVVEFTVLRPVWQRWWFFALCMLGLTAIAYTLHRRRLAQALALARVRTRIAEDLHDDIGSSLSQIAILSEVAQRQPDGDAIQQIAGTARELVDSMSDIVWAINPKHDRLENLLHRMRRFAEETLGARNIDLHFETVTAESSLRTPPEIRRQVFLVFKEAIANVAKHSGATSAKVGLTLEGDWLHIAVRDNGCGFDPTIDSDGNGLINMRRRVEATGGTFQLESAPRGGTRILASVALKAGRVREPLSFGRGA